MLEKCSFKNELPRKCSLAVGIYADGTLSESAKKMDELLGGCISKNIEKIDFKKKKLFDTCSFVCDKDEYNYVVFVCLGEADKKFSAFELEQLGSHIYDVAKKLDATVAVAIDSADLHVPCPCAPAYVSFGALLKSWSFDKYKSKKDSAKLKEFCLIVTDPESANKQFAELKNISDGVFVTRTVVSEPANVIYPESFSDIARDELATLGVKVEVLKKDELEKLGMNALLGVAQGSERDPRVVVARWNGGGKDDKPLAFVGKGVTFDSGGISIKPDNGMDEMKCDMAGAGAVLGLLKAVALNKLPVNVVGIMAMVENMPSGSAQRPGDIVKSMSGQTIEILSTDAEGRLILGDALWYAQDRFKPQAIVDLATLTGAIVVALGHEFAGLFSNCDDLAEKIKASSEVTGEKVWRMPLSKHFDEGIDSDIADMRNLGKQNIRAGSSTAAQFLQRFVNGVNWAHLDIAGVETVSNDLFICEKGATGFGVHLLYDFIQKNYVKKADADADADSDADAATTAAK